MNNYTQIHFYANVSPDKYASIYLNKLIILKVECTYTLYIMYATHLEYPILIKLIYQY